MNTDDELEVQDKEFATGRNRAKLVGDNACWPFATPPAQDAGKLREKLAINEQRAQEKGL